MLSVDAAEKVSSYGAEMRTNRLGAGVLGLCVT